MQLTLFTDYALRMLMYLGLSDDERPIPIQEVSAGCVATDDADCPLVPSCQLRGVLGEAEEEFYRVLDGYTLADIITRKERLTPLLGLAR